ncbi:MAG: hypothetical protein ACK5WY_05215 [Holosporaceae bacterium]|jgi:hypothetical protein
MPHPSFFKISCKQSKSHNPRAGFALAIVLLTLFLLGVIGAYLATGFGSRDTEVQNRAAVVQDVVTSVIQVKNVVDTCVATQSGLPDGVKSAPTFFAGVTNLLVPNYPFAVDAPTNPASDQCNVSNLRSSWVPALWGWASNICCLRDPSTGSRAAYNPWVTSDTTPPIVGQSSLFANPAQPTASWVPYNPELSTNVGSYSSADGLMVVTYANNNYDYRATGGGVSGVSLTIKPAANYINDASVDNLMQTITDRLNNLGLSAFYCRNPDPYFYRTVWVRLYRQPGTFVNPCPGSTDTAVVP